MKIFASMGVRMNHAHRDLFITQCFCVKCDTQSQTHKCNYLYTQVDMTPQSYSDYSNCLCAEELDDL